MSPDNIYYLFDVGRKRRQEDYIWPLPGTATVNDKVFVVCDGSGSFDEGRIPSKLICEFMGAKVLKFAEHKMSDELINGLLVEARGRLVSYAREYRLDTDLATTFTMLILYDQKALVSWVGDSRIYHLREGEILFSTENKSLVNKAGLLDFIPLHPENSEIKNVIKADNSPINCETQWIEDVRDGDYFLLCSKGLLENVKDDDIKSILKQDDKANTDLAKSFNKLASGKTLDNYSMYLIRINRGTRKRVTRKGLGINNSAAVNLTPVSILALTIVGLISLLFYFRKGRDYNGVPVNTNQKGQTENTSPHDSVRHPILKPESAKPIPSVTDSVRENNEDTEASPDNSANIETEKIKRQADQAPLIEKKSSGQLLLKLTTNESCKLKIKNIDLDEVIDWDLSWKDNGTIYLKPGNYSIVAMSLTDTTNIKTYHFDVKPGNATTKQNLHISF